MSIKTARTYLRNNSHYLEVTFEETNKAPHVVRLPQAAYNYNINSLAVISEQNSVFWEEFRYEDIGTGPAILQGYWCIYNPSVGAMVAIPAYGDIETTSFGSVNPGEQPGLIIKTRYNGVFFFPDWRLGAKPHPAVLYRPRS